ncbi:hypothetical protein V9K97_13660 [Variovorax sp. CCNWLW186]|uniref:hypothetical protein n=1 Tax=Variovorax sp. CCNWLW186 TaxID=3127473 RepID=UPI003076E37E
MSKPIPYPADVRAKGWRFELDHEKIEQSATWALAPPELRPWLLMLWMTAWKQTPCGTLDDDDALIAARIGMPLKTFQKHRGTLRRGWWCADDGRLYHDTITQFVIDMMTRRRKESDRKALSRAKTPLGVPPLSRGTTAGLHPESDTGTGTGTGKEETTTTSRTTAGEVVGDQQSPTKAGEVCRAIKAKKVADVNPSSPELIALIAKGVPVETFEAAAEICAKATPPKGFAYLLGIVKRQLGEAAVIASGAGMPTKPWDADRPSIEAKGVELGLGKWNEHDLSEKRERFDQYTARVRHLVEGGRHVTIDTPFGMAHH